MTHRSLVHGLRLFTWLAGLVALAGCAVPLPDGQDEGAEPVAGEGQAIMGGTSDPGDKNVVNIIGQSSQGMFECSGSLLAPNMVLTAHHCVADVLPLTMQGVDCAVSYFGAPYAPGDFWVSTGEYTPQSLTGFHFVTEVHTPPASASAKLCGIDQAILILKDNIQPSEAAPLTPRVDVPVTAGEMYTAIGFGLTSDSANDPGTRRKLTGLLVNCVGKTCDSLYGGQINDQHEFVGDHGTCEGDSGGPALDTLNRVFGVTSRGGQGCSSPIYGDVYSWADWIKQTALHAAQLGNYSAPNWANGWPTDPAYSYPLGGTCGDPTSCPSNLCLSDAAGSYCTRECETAAPCPDPYTCQTVSGQQLCQRPAPSASGGTPGAKSGCNVQGDEPTKPVPWFLGAGLFALAMLRRRTR